MTTNSTPCDSDDNEKLRLAREVFLQYHAHCFWWMKKELEIELAHLPEIARNLRLHGGRDGLLLAEKLCPSIPSN